jgi:2'-5' RNA ligase
VDDAGPVDDTRPLVVTLALADEDQRRLDDLRRAHFPPERNHLGAHVTLFHALPGERAAAVAALLAGAARRPAFAVEVTGVRLLGRGVALALRSDDLAHLHARLQRAAVDAFGDAVTAQDRQRLSPHVTVQNKVAPERARALHAELSAGFTPGRVRATGLALWRYAGGPWEPLSTTAFTPAP